MISPLYCLNYCIYIQFYSNQVTTVHMKTLFEFLCNLISLSNLIVCVCSVTDGHIKHAYRLFRSR